MFVSGGQPIPPDFRRRARVSFLLFLFFLEAGFAGALGLISLRWPDFGRRLVFRGFSIGVFYGIWYLYQRRWVLEFPIIQRPSFFSFKMGIPVAAQRALRLSTVAYLFSTTLAVFIPGESKGRDTFGKFIIEQITLFVGTFVVLLCWELNHHLHQVLHTKRIVFAPPKGSAAAEANPSEPLLAALEESTSRSLIRYHAYLDLCMVCENNVDTWRRAAFFEETGETYKRVMAACLKPLERLASELGEGLDSSNSVDKSLQLSDQLKSPANLRSESRIYESFNDFQLCTWCARIVSMLTVHSHKEDRFGVAQLSGSNAAAMSALLSCLLAVEALIGKKTNLPSPQHLTGPSNIKWATQSSGRKEVAASGVIVKKRGNPLYSKAYSMADILRTSIYCIVSAFHDEMANSAKSGLLDKEWITNSKPLFGTHELLLQKLRLFLEFRAN